MFPNGRLFSGFVVRKVALFSKRHRTKEPQYHPFWQVFLWLHWNNSWRKNQLSRMDNGLLWLMGCYWFQQWLFQNLGAKSLQLQQSTTFVWREKARAFNRMTLILKQFSGAFKKKLGISWVLGKWWTIPNEKTPIGELASCCSLMLFSIFVLWGC